MGAVKPVGQLYGSPTALTSLYLAWVRYCTYVVQTPRVEKRIVFGTNKPPPPPPPPPPHPPLAPEPREGDQSLM